MNRKKREGGKKENEKEREKERGKKERSRAFKTGVRHFYADKAKTAGGLPSW